MLAQKNPRRLEVLPDTYFHSPDDQHHRLRIWHDKDGRTVILMDWDFHAQSLEHKQRTMTDVTVNISMFGKITALGNDVHNEIRRRIRSKTHVPHMPSQAIVPLPPGPRPVSRNVDVADSQALQPARDVSDDKIQVLGRTMSRVRPALDLKEITKKLIHAANN